MKGTENRRGITLIALVVTIIVLLILAGVSISMLTGNNGILKEVVIAKEKTEQAQVDEQKMLEEYENEMQESINENKDLPESAIGQKKGTIIKTPESYGRNPNAQAVADGEGKYFAKPNGAKYIEGTVDTGIVISIRDSEFVWVPVNDVVLDSKKISEIPKNSNITTNKNTYTPMAIKVGENYKGILYDYSGSNVFLRYPDKENYQGDTSEYREPDIVSYDIDENKNEGITEEKMNSEYKSMIESVLKYNGFYVSRYEPGLDKKTKKIVFKNASVDSNNTVTTGVDNKETKTWYGLYKKLKEFTTDSDNVVSSMIWGSQYDAMMNWLAKKGNAVGDVADEKKRNNELITGKNANDIINNIYDLYGCHYELTLEVQETENRTSRGGSAESNIYLTYRSTAIPSNTNRYDTARATLYIK